MLFSDMHKHDAKANGEHKPEWLIATCHLPDMPIITLAAMGATNGSTVPITKGFAAQHFPRVVQKFQNYHGINDTCG